MRKYTRRKHTLTREVLDENQIWVEIGEDGQPNIYQKYKQTGKGNHSGQWTELRKPHIQPFYHPVSGNAYNCVTVKVKIDGKYRFVVASNIIWVYFNGSIPEGYDVDHINDVSTDNRLENLQLLTRTENIRKRGPGKNQYNC